MSFSNSNSQTASMIERPESICLPQAKTIIVGDSTVGKSSIIWKYICEDFRFNMPPTVGITLSLLLSFKIIKLGLDCNAKTIRLDEKNELKLVIWDTAGQEKYRSLITNYFKDAHGALIVFDLTVRESFEGIKKIWLDTLKKHAPEKICKVILGNKCDRIEEIEVTDSEIFEFEKEYNLKCFKTSAKDNIGINDSFNYLAKQMADSFLFMTSIENKTDQVLNPDKKAKKKGIICVQDKKKHHDDNSDNSMTGCCQ